MNPIFALTLGISLTNRNMKNCASISSKLIHARKDKSVVTNTQIDIEKVQSYHDTVLLRMEFSRDHLNKLRAIISIPVNWPRLHHVREKMTIRLQKSLKLDDPQIIYMIELDAFLHSLYSALEAFAGEICLCYDLNISRPGLRNISRKMKQLYPNEPMSQVISKFADSDTYKHFANMRHLVAHRIALGLIYAVDTSSEGELTTQNLCLPDDPTQQPFTANNQFKTIPYCENVLAVVHDFLETSYEILEKYLFI